MGRNPDIVTVRQAILKVKVHLAKAIVITVNPAKVIIVVNPWKVTVVAQVQAIVRIVRSQEKGKQVVRNPDIVTVRQAIQAIQVIQAIVRIVRRVKEKQEVIATMERIYSNEITSAY